MTLKYFFISFSIIFIIMAFVGAAVMIRSVKFRLLGDIILVSLGSYFIILTVIYPVTADISRYFLPAIPFLGIAVSVLIKSIFEVTSGAKPLIISISLFVICYAFYGLVPEALHHRSRGLEFDTIVEKNIVSVINNHAPQNSIVLVYEMQDRYYLRDDISVLSLDGITDGKVAPYLSTGDLYSFLMKYKPNYWLANDAVYYRPFLKHGILKEVLEEAVKKRNPNVLINNISFIKVVGNNKHTNSGFAAYRVLFKLMYGK